MSQPVQSVFTHVEQGQATEGATRCQVADPIWRQLVEALTHGCDAAGDAIKISANGRKGRVVAGTAAKLVKIANPNLITDVGVSAVLAEAACTAARLNVEVNLKYIKDPELRRELQPELDEVQQTTERCRTEVSAAVHDCLSD